MRLPQFLNSDGDVGASDPVAQHDQLAFNDDDYDLEGEDEEKEDKERYLQLHTDCSGAHFSTHPYLS